MHNNEIVQFLFVDFIRCKKISILNFQLYDHYNNVKHICIFCIIRIFDYANILI